MILGSPYLTTHDVAAMLKVTKSTIRSRVAVGDLRAMRFGREYRIAAEDLEAFLEAHATRPARNALPAGTDRQREKN